MNLLKINKRLKMKNILSCLTLFMLGLGMMSAATNTQGYQGIHLINKSNDAFTLSFFGLDDKLSPASVMVEKGGNADITVKPGKVINRDERFQLKLTKGKSGQGVSSVDLPLNDVVDNQGKEFGFRVNENDSHYIWVIVNTKVLSSGVLEMIIELPKLLPKPDPTEKF